MGGGAYLWFLPGQLLWLDNILQLYSSTLKASFQICAAEVKKSSLLVATGLPNPTLAVCQLSYKVTVVFHPKGSHATDSPSTNGEKGMGMEEEVTWGPFCILFFRFVPSVYWSLPVRWKYSNPKCSILRKSCQRHALWIVYMQVSCNKVNRPGNLAPISALSGNFLE